jgi:hypothetical protein
MGRKAINRVGVSVARREGGRSSRSGRRPTASQEVGPQPRGDRGGPQPGPDHVHPRLVGTRGEDHEQQGGEKSSHLRDILARGSGRLR